MTRNIQSYQDSGPKPNQPLFESEDDLLEPYVLSTLLESSRSMATVICEVDVDDSAIDGAALGVGEGGASKLVSGEVAANGSDGAGGIDNRCFFVPFVNAEIEANGLFIFLCQLWCYRLKGKGRPCSSR